MRRSARVLSTAVAGAAPGAVAAPASADPAARITPRTVAPGGPVTVPVSCDAVGGALPACIDATSCAVDESRVRLNGVGGHDCGDGGRMQARSPSAAGHSGTARIPAGGTAGGPAEAVGPAAERGVDGSGPLPSSGREKPWNVSFTAPRDGPEGQDRGQRPGQGRFQGQGQGQEGDDDRGQGQPPPGVQHGAQAGTGRASVPTPVAGGPLIAAALGAAAHRLRRHGPGVDR
ncbi:hypothetical protein ABZ890_02390 [Streptomyces sp. NPDC046984]|uniref:hypothetical protein n=1 Tax=Streptomyces sp. NPDC046984 TaxID=3155138 RepID=UPI0033ED7150